MNQPQTSELSLLDILFEHRNKQYGAYTLRKFYGQRLSTALTITMAASVSLVLLLSSGSGRKGIAGFLGDHDSVIIRTYIIDPPPEAPRPPAATRPPSGSAVPTDIVPDDQVPVIPNLPEHPGIPGETPEAGTPGPPCADCPTAPAPVVAGPVGMKPKDDPEPEFAPSEVAPSFPGGMEAWRKFLGRHLTMPDELEAGAQRKVLVRFYVRADGKVSDFEIIQSGGEAFNAEVIRVLKKMPRWDPAMQNGRAIATTFVQPVIFQSGEE